MLRKLPLEMLALIIALVVGFALSRIPTPQTAYAQEAGQVLVQGYGRAISSVRPPDSEYFTLIASNEPRGSFNVVPAGKKFVLTDVMYNAQGSVRQELVVNILNAYPAIQKQNILFQVRISRGESDQVHLCSGYVIPAGNALVAYTDANREPEQYVSISVTGYLADE